MLSGELREFADRSLAQVLAHEVEQWTMVVMEQPIGSDHVDSGSRYMLSIAMQEFLCAEFDGVAWAPAEFVVFVAQVDAVSVVTESLVRDRTALDISGEIYGHASAVFVLLHDLDMPLLPAALVQQIHALLGRKTVGKRDFAAVDCIQEEGSELAAELGAQNARWQKEARRRRFPLGAGHAPSGDQHMNVRMYPERLPPTVERCNHPGKGSKILRVGQQFPERVPRGTEEKSGKCVAIELPPRVQFVGDGEDYVEVVASRETRLLSGKPALRLEISATGTTAMFARVGFFSLNVPGRACLNMPSGSTGPATLDRTGRPMDALR